MSAVLDSGHKNVYLGERVWWVSQLGLESWLEATNVEFEKKLCIGLIEAMIGDAELGPMSYAGRQLEFRWGKIRNMCLRVYTFDSWESL